MADVMEVEASTTTTTTTTLPNLETMFADNFLGTQELYVGHYAKPKAALDNDSYRLHVAVKTRLEYSFDGVATPASSSSTPSSALVLHHSSESHMGDDDGAAAAAASTKPTTPAGTSATSAAPATSQALVLSHAATAPPTSSALISIGREEIQPPQWHAPWKLMRVISGSLGWVRCAAVDPSNEWFATGSSDNTIVVRAPCRPTQPLRSPHQLRSLV